MQGKKITMSDIIDYVRSLKGSQDQKVDDFINKLSTPIEYKSILDRFDWNIGTKRLIKYFAELDTFLINVGYCGRDDIIVEVKEFLRAQIKKIGILPYNKIMCASIWNHFDFLEMNPTEINWFVLSKNPAGVDLLKKHPINIDWDGLSCNPAALPLLKRNIRKIEWWYLSQNPAAIPLLKKYSKKISWGGLSRNPAAIDLLIENPDKINWKYLSENPAAIDLLKANRDKIVWNNLSRNTAAIELLEEHAYYNKIKEETEPFPYGVFKLLAYEDDINWCLISENPAAIDFLKMNPDKINWQYLSGNPAAIDLLKMNPDKIDWGYLSANPSAIDLLKANQDKIKSKWRYNNYLSGNSYDYFAEKINHFNELKLFPCSRLEL